MGRELKRVALDFEWPLDEVWDGFINPLPAATQCEVCDGSGLSVEGKHLQDLWYGYIPFNPADKGSIPFTTADEAIVEFATRNVERSPEYYGRDAKAVARESLRLCNRFNSSWSHHLNADDVTALLNEDRLKDFTHTWTSEEGWKLKEPPYIPTPREVNVWSIGGGRGHDSGNQWICAKAECKRLDVSILCSHCEGEGSIWPSQETKQAYEGWEPTEPPAGEGYQIWETVSEGSPISPVFSSAHDLAKYMVTTRWGADKGTSFETWMKFIEGPGWAPSAIMDHRGVQSGVNGLMAD